MVLVYQAYRKSRGWLNSERLLVGRRASSLSECNRYIYLALWYRNALLMMRETISHELDKR